MRDVCAACGRPIFTVHVAGPPISLTHRWTHGGIGFIDRQHIPIPSDPKHLAQTKITPKRR